MSRIVSTVEQCKSQAMTIILEGVRQLWKMYCFEQVCRISERSSREQTEPVHEI